MQDKTRLILSPLEDMAKGILNGSLLIFALGIKFFRTAAGRKIRGLPKHDGHSLAGAKHCERAGQLTFASA